jgi:predicted N-acyltransferase
MAKEMIRKLVRKVKESKENHRLRKAPSGYGLSLFDSIHYTPADHWSKVTKDSFFMQHAYLSAMESNPPTNMHFRYALVYDGKEPIAACYFQLIDLSAESLGTLVDPEKENRGAKTFKENVKDLLKKNAGKVSVRILICGNAFASGEHGFICAKGVDKAKAFHGLADAIYRVRRANKLHGQVAAVLIKDFYDPGLKSSRELEKYDYYGFSVEPAMILDLDKKWKTFDEYLNAMSSKYRRRAKAVIRKGEAIERRALCYEDIIRSRKKIEKLYDAVHYKAKFRLASLTMDYFAVMQKELPGNYSFTAYYLGDKMVGFRTTFIDDHSVEAHFIGIDYKVNREYDIYQNILYDYVKEAYERDVHRVYLGRTASEMKSTLGAVAHNLTCYVRHRNTISNKLIKPFIEYLEPSQWIQRNPFKDEKEEAPVAMK